MDSMREEKNMAGEDKLWKLRKTFYECRDFEINNLWQKSILLTTFFVLEFSVYGNIVSKLLDVNSGAVQIIIFQEICSVLSIVGVVFSFIWIMMAKGSKAWYELYETAICTIEQDKRIKIPRQYVMGEVYGEQPIDSNVFSNKAGSYSPSKLNIVVGRVFLIIWTAIFAIHTIFEILWIKSCFEKGRYPCWHCCIIVVLLFTFMIVYITALCNTWAKSSFLQNQ